MTFLLCGFFTVHACHSSPVFAQAPENVRITSSPNPVGSGARALGMGGAFIAVADDATAASWNPGGLVQLERPEVSAVGEAFYRTENNTFDHYPQASGRQNTSSAGLNYLSFAYPFSFLNRNMVFSLNYQHLYDFSRSWHLSFAGDRFRQTNNYDTTGGLYVWGLAYAVQIIPQVSFGFTFNIWQDGIYPNQWENVTTTNNAIRSFVGPWFESYSIQKDRYAFTGFNANLGLLWNVTDKLTFGAVFKTPFSGDLKHQYIFRTYDISPLSSRRIPRERTNLTTDENLDMPLSYGIGLAYRFSDRFTLSADAYRTRWQDFVLTDATGRQISPITAGLVSEADIDPTTQFHLGAEYLFIQPKYTIPLRAGFFYDPAPAKGSPDEYLGFSLGSGIGIGRFVFDAAYVCRFGKDVGSSSVPGLAFSQNVTEHSIYTSLIIHF